MKNVGKHGDIKILIRERRSNYLVSEPSYYATKLFTENLPTIGMEKTLIITNKHGCLGLD